MATGIMGNIANMFRPTQQVTLAQPPAQPAPAAPMAQQNPGADPAAAPAEPASPLDGFSALWQTDPKAAPTADPLAASLFASNAQGIQDAASKMDFLAKVPQDVMAKAMGGDAASIMQVMQFGIQQGLSTAAQLSTATVEHGMRRNNERLLGVLPDRVKQIQLDQSAPENPVLSHAAAQPFLTMVRSQVKMKNPSMSVAEINKEAERMLTGFASAVVGMPQEAQAAAGSDGSEDWDKFLSS